MNTSRHNPDAERLDKAKTYGVVGGLVVGVIILVVVVTWANKTEKEHEQLEDTVISSSILVQGTSSYPATVEGKRVMVEGVDCVIVVGPTREGAAISCDWPRKD